MKTHSKLTNNAKLTETDIIRSEDNSDKDINYTNGFLCEQQANSALRFHEINPPGSIKTAEETQKEEQGQQVPVNDNFTNAA